MADHRTNRILYAQRPKNTVCPDCGADVIEFFNDGLLYRLDAAQAPINRTPIEHSRNGRMVWRLNLSTKRWGYEPAAPRGADPVHLDHVCPTAGQS